MDPERVYLSRTFLEFFLKPVYRTMMVEKFQIHGLRVLENIFVSQKIESVLNLKTLPHYDSRQEEITHFPQIMFFENLFLPSRKWEGL